MFRVGQKVVCVDDASGRYGVPGFRYASGLHGLTAGEVYTVRAVVFYDTGPWSGPRVFLDEIIRPPSPCGRGEAPYSALRFRPVQEKGMEMLRAILVHPKSPVKEDA